MARGNRNNSQGQKKARPLELGTRFFLDITHYCLELITDILHLHSRGQLGHQLIGDHAGMLGHLFAR